MVDNLGVRTPNWKFAVYSRSLPRTTPQEAVELAAQAGYDGIEWRVHPEASSVSGTPSVYRNNRCQIVPTVEAAAQVGAWCSAAGLAIPSLTSYVKTGDVGSMARLFDMAAEVGAEQIRLFPIDLDARGYSVLFTENRRYLEAITPMAQAAGVAVAVQIHWGSICPSASLAERLVRGLDPAVVRVILDPGNMAIEGFEDYRIGTELLGDHLCYVYVKNAQFVRSQTGKWVHKWSAIDEGVVDFLEVFRALRESGYQGWLSDSDFSDTRRDADQLKWNISYMRTLADDLEWVGRQ